MKKLTLILLPVLWVTGCQTMKKVDAGPFKLNSGAVVMLEQDWTQFPKAWHSAESTLLTQDGLSLNQLHLVTVEDGDTFLSENSKSSEYPVYKKGMSVIKQVDFLTANLSRLGLENLQERNVKPAKIGGYDGITMNLDGQYSSGLNMRARVAMAETDQGLNLVIFFAPSSHYYAKDIASVNRMIETIQFPSSKS